MVSKYHKKKKHLKKTHKKRSMRTYQKKHKKKMQKKLRKKTHKKNKTMKRKHRVSKSKRKKRSIKKGGGWCQYGSNQAESSVLGFAPESTLMPKDLALATPPPIKHITRGESTSSCPV